MDVDRSPLDVYEGFVVPFDVQCCKIWMTACTKEVPLGVMRCAIEVAKARPVVSRCSEVRRFDCLGPSSRPESTVSVFENVPDGGIPD